MRRCQDRRPRIMKAQVGQSQRPRQVMRSAIPVFLRCAHGAQSPAHDLSLIAFAAAASLPQAGQRWHALPGRPWQPDAPSRVRLVLCARLENGERAVCRKAGL